MQTHVIENHAEHPFDFPVADKMEAKTTMGNVIVHDPKKRLVFPRHGVRKNDVTGAREPAPGVLEVTDAQLKMLMEHPVAKGWFGPGKLQVVETKGKPDKSDK